MKKFAVAFFNYDDNTLKIEIVEAYTWKNAVLQHSEIAKNNIFSCILFQDFSVWKDVAYNYDCMIDVIEIK